MSTIGNEVTKAVVDASTGNKKTVLGKLEQMLNRNGIDVEEVGRIHKVSVYQSITKNDEGEAEKHDLYGIQFDPIWKDGPEWPVVQPGPAINIKPLKSSAKNTDWPCAVVLPDIQMGFFKGVTGDLEATHDEAALSVALQIVKIAKPVQVVLVGDNLDLPEFGKYRLSPAYAQTTQATIDRATEFCAELRQAAPDAEIIWLAGNHEERVPNYILDNAKAAFGLRRGRMPDSWPVLSVPNLCRFDEFGIQYLSGYPASYHWITPRLRVIHGNKVASNNSTAHKYLATEKTSVIYGHIHRLEWAERTREDYDGAKTILAASPGCLARIDGAVPSTKGGIDLDGRPLHSTEDWQQGVAVVPYHPESGNFVYEQVPIRNGWAMWRGKEYVAK
jgi:hypothetical protein